MTPTTDDHPRDRRRLTFVLGLAIVVHAWTVLNTTVPSRDCIVFARYALHLETPGGTWKDPDRQLNSPVEVIEENEHPPAYPAAVLLMSKVVRPIVGETSARSMGLSAQLVNALAGILLAVPGYFLLRRVFDPNLAVGALAVYEVLPVFVEVTSDGLSDGLFLLTAVSALWFAVRALDAVGRAGAAGNGLGAGLCCGVGSLTRPDTAMVAGAIGLTFAGAIVVRKKSGGAWRVPLAAGAGLIVGWLALAGPYMVLIGGITNKPGGNKILTGDGNATYIDRGAARPTSLPLAAWWNPTANADDNKPLWAVKALWSEYWKAAHYLSPFFALFGLYALRRRLTDARVVLLLVLFGLHAIVLWVLAWKINYVSQRHTLIEVFVTCVFAAAAFPGLGATATRWWKRGHPWGWGAIWVAIFIATALPRDVHSLHAERAGHKAAGLWLKDHGDPAVETLDPLAWSEWYAGRTVTKWPNPFPTKPIGPWRYVIFEPNGTSPHSRLPRYDEAKRLANKPDSRMVYHYPPDAGPEKIIVAVYLCKTRK